MARRPVVAMICLGLLTGLAGNAVAETDLKLLGERFRVSATWSTADGASGDAQAKPLTAESGLFWFFSESNTELVVKILDACAPPYDRFWFYAAGLTNVEVELTVVDTWTGQTKSYQRPGGPLFASIADTTTFSGCDEVRSCGQGVRAEIAATPRPDHEAEALALLLGPGVSADPAIYDRLVDDLKRIRTLSPSLADVAFLLIWDPSSLLVELTPAAHQALKARQFSEWDCLNGWYRGEVSHIYDFFPEAHLEFEGFFHPFRIGSDYEALPGIVKTSPNYMGYPSGGPLNDLCATIEGTAYDYFFDDQIQDQISYIRVPQAGAAPVTLGQATHQGPPPEWWPLLEQCRAEIFAAASH